MPFFRWFLPFSMLVVGSCGGEKFTAVESDAGSGGTGPGSGGAGGSTSASGGSGGASGSSAGGAAGVGGASDGSGGALRDAGTGGGGNGGASGGPAGPNYSDCDTNAECAGGACVPLTPGGYRVCVVPVPEAACSTPAGECCATKDCQGHGRCVRQGRSSCGLTPAPINICGKDECTRESDCTGPSAVCVPAGALGRTYAQCMAGSCRLDRDCTAEPGGSCALVVDPCCGAARGLFCVYGQGDCRGACPQGSHCAVDNGRARCVTGLDVCLM